MECTHPAAGLFPMEDSNYWCNFHLPGHTGVSRSQLWHSVVTYRIKAAVLCVLRV